MNLKNGDVNKSDVARHTQTKEDDIYRATNNDHNRPLANYWDGIKHPETGEHLRSDYELHDKSGECLYAQFSDKQNDSYHYIQESDKSVDMQVNEDRELAKELEQDRGR